MIAKRMLVPSVWAAAALLLAGCGAGVQKATEEKPPATADKVVEKVAKKLEANRPDYAWAALPPTYRKDVDGLVKEFAAQTDPEIYNTNFGLLKKVVKVLETKKDLIVGHSQLKEAKIDTAGLSKNWEAVVKLASIPLNSELADVNRLKKMDIENFLATTGSQFMKQMQVVSQLAPAPKEGAEKTDLSRTLKGCKATVVKTEGDRATVRIEAPDVKAREEEFVRVEEHWIPKELADNWQTQIADIKAKLKELGGGAQAADKAKFLALSKQFDGVLDMMLAAKTEQDLTQAVQQGMGVVMGLVMGAMSGSGGADQGMPSFQGMPGPRKSRGPATLRPGMTSGH